MNISYLTSNYDNEPKTAKMSWKEVVQIFTEPHMVSDDKNVEMFNFTQWKDNGYETTDKGHLRRCKSNALGIDALVLDYDSGTTIEEFQEQYKDFEYLLYTSYNHRNKEEHDYCDQFRVIIPLKHRLKTEWLEPERYLFNHDITFLPSLLTFFDGCDPTTFQPTRVFFLPSCPPQKQHLARTIHNKGRSFDINSDIKPRRGIRREKSERMKEIQRTLRAKEMKRRSLNFDDIDWQDLDKNPFVSRKAVDKYLATPAGWYTRRFGFMVSVASIAKLKGYSITAGEIVMLFNQLDARDGCWYSGYKDQRALLRDAQSAIRRV